MTIPSAAAEEAAGIVDVALTGHVIEGRSLGRIAWDRIKRDRVAIVSATFLVLLVVAAILARPIAEHIGGGPFAFHEDLVDPTIQMPIGSFGGMSLHHPLGIEPVDGRDMAARILLGAQYSLLIAGLATFVQMMLGVTLGIVAGYFGGAIDAVINWLMAVFLAFPVVLFGIALGAGLPQSALGLQANALHIVMLVILIGFFGWAYIGRVIRGLVISLREREFVDAARSLGAGNFRILFHELLPNLLAPIIVYTTLLLPTNILAEAAFSFLGVGIQLPNPSWGQMLYQSLAYFQIDPMFMLVPGMAIFLTVLAFNLLGDSVRDAFDPKASR
jgi:peptide/nickel transport system permease protein